VAVQFIISINNKEMYPIIKRQLKFVKVFEIPVIVEFLFKTEISIDEQEEIINNTIKNIDGLAIRNKHLKSVLTKIVETKSETAIVTIREI
jgi:hypothetical protein